MEGQTMRSWWRRFAFRHAHLKSPQMSHEMITSTLPYIPDHSLLHKRAMEEK